MRVTRIKEIFRTKLTREELAEKAWERALEATQGDNSRRGRRRLGIYGPTRGYRGRMAPSLKTRRR